jgi:hypothetical protein
VQHVVKNGGNQFKFVSEHQALKLKDLTTEDKEVYRAIEDAGDMGALMG